MKSTHSGARVEIPSNTSLGLENLEFTTLHESSLEPQLH
jgi:hypothetical protein